MKKSFKQRFFLLRNLFVSLINGIRSRKTTRYKVMLFSNFFNRSFSLVISKRHVFVSLTVFLLLSMFTILFYINLSQREIRLKQRMALAETYDLRIAELEQYGKKVIDYNENYEKQIEEIFTYLGDVNSEELWTGKIVGLDGQGEVASEEGVFKTAVSKISGMFDVFTLGEMPKPEMLQLIEEKSKRTKRTLEHLRDIETFFSLRGELRQHIPSGWPLRTKIGYKTSGYGPRLSPFSDKIEFHTGVDIAAPKNTPIVATADGVVTFSGEKTGYGLIVEVRHKYGHSSSYSHNESLAVAAGQRVKKGQTIAGLGNTGRSTGNHIHFEIKLNGKFVDPWPYVIADF